MVVSIHGGPDLRERAIFRGRSNYILNELGVAILYPNVRGSIGFGRKFEQLDDGKLRGDAVKDIGALLDWIATQPGVGQEPRRAAAASAPAAGWRCRPGSPTTTGFAASSRAPASRTS